MSATCLFDDFNSYAGPITLGSSLATAFNGEGYQLWDTGTGGTPTIGSGWSWSYVNDTQRVNHWTAGNRVQSVFFNITQDHVLGFTADVGGWGDNYHATTLIVTTNLGTYTYNPVDTASAGYSVPSGYVGSIGFTTSSITEHILSLEFRSDGTVGSSAGSGEAIGIDNLKLDYYTTTAVPEPGGALLLCTFGLGLLLRRRR